jgi:hypothetical protein
MIEYSLQLKKPAMPVAERHNLLNRSAQRPGQGKATSSASL